MRIRSHDGAHVERCTNYFDDEDRLELLEMPAIVLPDAEGRIANGVHHTVTLA